MDSNDKQLSVIGGGITGLSAAYEALKRGETNIHVYEATDRFGGKIKSGMIGSTVINKGAECVDSDHNLLISLCKDMNVSLSENPSMNTETFQRPNGSVMDSDTFYAAYKPYAEQVIRDRELMQNNPNSHRAQYLKHMNLSDYIAELRENVPPASRGFWQVLKDAFHLHGNESPTALTIAANTYTSEVGQPLKNVSAAQFIGETSATTDCLLASDCKYMVDGGTEHLIEQLRAHLEAKGVKFHTNAQLSSITKNAQGGNNLTFTDAALNTSTDKMILALPTYALGKVNGLSELGLQNAEQLGNMQYTKNAKFTVAFKPGMATPPAAFYANGFQCWSSAPGYLTFLAEAGELGSTKSPKELLSGFMESYAKSHGSTAEKMFDTTQLNFTNPGSAPCYASPAPGQTELLYGLQSQLPALAKNGIGIAGTYIPHKGGYGFMECGIASAQKSVDMLLSQEQSVGLEQQKQWAPQIIAQRAAAANDASMAIRA